MPSKEKFKITNLPRIKSYFQSRIRKQIFMYVLVNKCFLGENHGTFVVFHQCPERCAASQSRWSPFGTSARRRHIGWALKGLKMLLVRGWFSSEVLASIVLLFPLKDFNI